MVSGMTQTPIFNQAQMAHYIGLMSAYGSERQNTLDALGRDSRALRSTYNMDRRGLQSLIQSSIINPSNYDLELKLKNLQHSNERHSAGRLAREESARAVTAQGQQSAISSLLGQERQQESAAMESAFARMMKAKELVGQSHFAPLQVQGMENFVGPGNSVGNAIGMAGSMFSGTGQMLNNFSNLSAYT